MSCLGAEWLCRGRLAEGHRAGVYLSGGTELQLGLERDQAAAKQRAIRYRIATETKIATGVGAVQCIAVHFLAAG